MGTIFFERDTFWEQFSIWLVFKRAIFHGTVFREGRTFYQKMVITWGRFRKIFLVSFFTKQNKWQVPYILLWFGSQWPLRNTSWRLRSINARKRYYSNTSRQIIWRQPFISATKISFLEICCHWNRRDGVQSFKTSVLRFRGLLKHWYFQAGLQIFGTDFIQNIQLWLNTLSKVK